MKFSKSLLLFLAFGFIATASSIFFQDVQTSSAQLGQSGGSSIAVRDLILVNADTNQDIGPLTNGYTLNVSAFGTENYSVRAETQPSQVGSVRFSLNGNENYQTENILPYSLGGDSQGGENYNPVVFQEGQNTITATPYTRRNAGGEAGLQKTITFNVVYGGEGQERGSDDEPENIFVEPVSCIDLTVGYNTQTVPQGYIQATWPGVSAPGATYKIYRNGSVVVQSQQNTGYTTSHLSAGNWTIGVSALVNEEESAVTQYTVNVGTSGQETFYDNCSGISHNDGETNSVSITSPNMNSNVVVGQPFTFSVQGSPTDDEIQSVSFYLHPGFGGLDIDPILLGSDTSSPFSIQASVSDRYYRCPHIYAVADLNDGTQIKTTNLHPVAITESPTNSPWQCTPQSVGGNTSDFIITSPQWASTSDPGYDAGVPFTISAQNNLSGVAMDYVKFYTADTFDGLNGWGFNLVSTDTTAPYTTQATINSPADYGHPYFTNHVRAIAYYSNGQVEPRLMPIKINPQVNPTTNPQIISLELVTASGQVIETLEGGEVINTGIGGYGSNISIRANANADTESVLFNLQKPVGIHTMIENNTPYAMFGDSNGTYATWQDLQNGPHTLTVTPYELDGQAGVTGTPVIIQFSLENNDDLIAPSVPANAEIEYRSNSTARVSWDTSTDNVGVTGYQVYKNGNAEGLPTGNLYRDLTSFQTGDVITVRATDAAGNWSSDSNPVNIPILSTQFTNGQTVSVSVQNGQTATVYSAPPSTSSNGNQTNGSQGTIQGSSVFWNGGYYWNVNFGSGPDGWVAQSQISGGSTPPPPTGDPIVTTPQRSLTPDQMVVVCNSAYSQSCSLADYYMQERGIPASNKVAVNITTTDVMNANSFNNYNNTGMDLRDYVLSQVTGIDIQGAVLMWRSPYAVSSSGNGPGGWCTPSGASCVSITNAFARGGFITADTVSGPSLTAVSYFDSESVTPKTDFDYIPTFIVPFDPGNYSQGQGYIDQAVAADNSYPSGEIYMLSTGDNARSGPRNSQMTLIENQFNQNNLGTTHYISPNFIPNDPSYGQMGGCTHFGVQDGDYIQNKTNVLGYFTGRLCPPNMATNTYLSGALADHLTSHGGVITNPPQMPITDWLNEGVAASMGTIKEPWTSESYSQIDDEFSNVEILLQEYYSGASALESYFKSVRKPGNTLFVGEPLVNPWKDPQITFANNTLTINITHIKPGQTWKLQSSTNGSTWSDVSGQTSITAPNGKYGLRNITVSNATSPYYRLVNTANPNLPQIPRPVNGNININPGGSGSTTFSPGDPVVVNDGTNGND